MLKVGLTGGIGSGKTTVANLFIELGTPVIDADETAKRLVEKDKPALAQIVNLFGKEMLRSDGGLDRAKLRTLIFNNPLAKSQLENILHPLVYNEIQQIINSLDSVYCVVCVPLLLETGMKTFVNRVLVVDCPVETQINRVRQRDQLSDEMTHRIIASQVSRETRLAQADDVIDNSSDGTELAQQVKKLHNFYQSTGSALR